jgi:hypothetical protein
MVVKLLAVVYIVCGLAAVGFALLFASELVPGTAFLAIVAYVMVAAGMTARAMTATHARTTPFGILMVLAAGAVLLAYLSLSFN